jgi:hypothetical protein
MPAGVQSRLTIVARQDVVPGLFCDAAIQVSRRDIKALQPQRSREAVAAGMPMILDSIPEGQ